MDEQFLTVDDMAARYGCTKSSIYSSRHRGQLPPAFRTNRLLWRLGDVEAWEAARTAPPAPPWAEISEALARLNATLERLDSTLYGLRTGRRTFRYDEGEAA